MESSMVFQIVKERIILNISCMLGIWDKKDTLVGKFFKRKTKLAIACALIHDSGILFLDEPTNVINLRIFHEIFIKIKYPFK